MEISPDCYIQSRLGRTTLLAFEEIMGEKNFNSTLGLASLSFLIENYPTDDGKKVISYETFGQLQSSLEHRYGIHAGKGITLRAGRAFLSNSLRIFGQELGLYDITYRLQPPNNKFMKFLQALAELLNQCTDQKIILDVSKHKILWHVRNCLWCAGSQGIEPGCHFSVGMLQEALYWVSSGKIYNIVEEDCIAKGDPTCLIVVDRTPLA